MSKFKKRGASSMDCTLGLACLPCRATELPPFGTYRDLPCRKDLTFLKGLAVDTELPKTKVALTAKEKK